LHIYIIDTHQKQKTAKATVAVAAAAGFLFPVFVH